jgi:threonine/homoserine/homoserine lactone efflux protein
VPLLYGLPLIAILVPLWQLERRRRTLANSRISAAFEAVAGVLFAPFGWLIALPARAFAARS